MGSGAEAAQEAVEYLNARGEKVGVLKVHLYRPFSIEHFLAALPKTVKSLAVLDRTKEAGATGDPLYVDVITALSEGWPRAKSPFANFPRVIGGRYGLSSKEFTPAMVKAVYDEMLKPAPRNHFSSGSWTTLRIPVWKLTPRSRRKIPRPCGPSSMVWVPTARWAPTRTPSR